MTVSVDQVKSDIKIFQKMSDEHIQLAIGMGQSQAQSDKIDPIAFDSGVILMAKYYLYIDWFKGNGGVTGASALGQSQTVANPDATSDGWLALYQDIVDRYGQATNLGSFDMYD
ncbi:hypothetical protein [Nicoliella lavandulae]|uniref:Uncharacterized protein n=1 Tax=Nicoliella lavandulae TaxID=3082954 RepID=A0ABU8SMA9_9LACO